jgi:glycine cleavage system H protein
MIPRGLLYTKEHEWLRLEGEAGVVGITDHAQSSLGDITFVELPPPGKCFATGETIGTVESVKTVSEIYSPVSCEILEVNPLLNDQPELVNSDPYQKGWMIRIKIRKADETRKLLNAADYDSFIAES